MQSAKVSNTVILWNTQNRECKPCSFNVGGEEVEIPLSKAHLVKTSLIACYVCTLWDANT